MSASPLPIFRLPCLITEDILKNMGPFELLSLSTLSTRSEQIVETYSRRRQFKVRCEIDEDYCLSLFEPRAPKLIIEFKISEDCGTEFRPASNTLQVYCEEISEAMPCVLEHLSTIFMINFIDLLFKSKDEKLKNKMNSVVQTLNLRIDDYCDLKNESTYQEVKSIMSNMRRGDIQVKYPKLTDFQLRRLLKQCVERLEPINLIFHRVAEPGLFMKIARMLKGDKQIFSTPHGGSLQLTQEDGRLMSVIVGCGLILIRVKQVKK